jgi:formylglycine-generating enzyme required for sulfatase activity
MKTTEGGHHGCAVWADEWGEDQYGIWADLRVNGVDGGGPPGWSPPGSVEGNVVKEKVAKEEVAKDDVVQRMRWIPAGEFWMGSGEEDEDRCSRDNPRHQVRLSRGYWLGDTPAPHALYKALMGENPSRFGGDEESVGRPVECVDWHMARKFHHPLPARLVGRRGREVPANNGLSFRFPTKAEGEFAC